MKGCRPERGPNRGPLRQGAGTLLKGLPGKRAGLLFTGSTKPVSDTTLRKRLRSFTGDSSTVRCLRSTFRDCVADCTSYKAEVAEAALAHVLGDDVKAAYWRGPTSSISRGAAFR